jgi:hypothetical protein
MHHYRRHDENRKRNVAWAIFTGAFRKSAIFYQRAMQLPARRSA